MIGTEIILSPDRTITSFKKKIKVANKVKYKSNYFIVTAVTRKFWQENDYELRYNTSIKIGDEKSSFIDIHKIADKTGKAIKSSSKEIVREDSIEAVITDDYIQEEIMNKDVYINLLYKY